MARLLFVDDHPLYRAGVQLSLARTMPELVTFLASSAKEAIGVLERYGDFDLCLSDMRLPGMDGLALLEIVGARWPTMARGLLCGEPSPDLARRAEAAGCVACLSKTRDMDELSEAVIDLFAGAAVFDLREPDAGGLSEKRRLVLELAAKGQSNKEIARELGITERTVKDHWSRIFERLDVANRAEAVSRAHQMRLI